MSQKVTMAAGTVTFREADGKRQVLLIHRPSHHDWTLPKGKLEPDEYAAVAAARETWEETGVSVALRHPLETITYPLGGATKVVHYWWGHPIAQRRRKPDREVDRVAWLSVKAALARMSYANEKDVLGRALDTSPTTPLLIVRHAKAMDRKHWSARDQARPITARGRRQAKALVPLLEAFGVRHLASSTSTRCMQTLLPYARRQDLDVHGWAVLSEEIGEDDPKGVTKLIRRLTRETAQTGIPAAVCGHRPVLPTMLAGLSLPNRPMQTAATVIAHLDAAGQVLASEFHRPRR